jgi:hypothetical protein
MVLFIVSFPPVFVASTSHPQPNPLAFLLCTLARSIANRVYRVQGFIDNGLCRGYVWREDCYVASGLIGMTNVLGAQSGRNLYFLGNQILSALYLISIAQRNPRHPKTHNDNHG